MRLTNVVPADVEWADRTLDDGECTRRWSLRGRTPPRAVIWALLWQDVTAQQAVRSDGGDPVALVQVTGLDLVDGVADAAVLATPGRAADVGPLATAFLDQVFRDLPLRKLSVAAVPGELDVPDYFGPRAELAGRLARHVRRGAEAYADVEIYDFWGAPA